MALDTLLQVMADRGASDLHLVPDAAPHLRVGGELVPFGPPLARAAVRALLAEVLDSRRRTEFDATHELDLAIERLGLGVFRVHVYRQRGNEAAVIRRIPAEVPDLASLGVPDALRALALERRGLVLVAGAAGSGRTTTVASMLDARNAERPGHLLTIEDPIEFRLKSRRAVVSQREVGTDTPSFAAALRSAARQGPDVVLVGELRDAATLDAALAHARTGHLVLSTLHANDACHALHRMVSWQAPEDRGPLLAALADGLRAIACQRLAPAVGGGRLAVFELLPIDPAARELLAQGRLDELRDAVRASQPAGALTFDQSLAQQVRDGRMRREDALARADVPTALERLLHLS